MLAVHLEVIFVAIWVLAIFTIGISGFIIVLGLFIRTGKFHWRGSPTPIERKKNPVAFWLSFVPFLFFIGMWIYACVNLIIEWCRGFPM